MPVKYRFNSLEDFLISTTFTVDRQLDDGWGASFPVKGREIAATVLFSDITGFSEKTRQLNPPETLVFVNRFFAWVTAEALRDSKGIIDKYIGDEMMIVFSSEFGSEDPFQEAVRVARRMGENDFYNYCPHIGIASGRVLVGYVGTPLKYNCSVFGAPVAYANRCAGVKPQRSEDSLGSCSIRFPAKEWGDRDFAKVLTPRIREQSDGSMWDEPFAWKLRAARRVKMKNLGHVTIREIVNSSMFFPQQKPEERAREDLKG